MNAEKLMDAIGAISDRYIEEFAVVKRKAKSPLWVKLATAAACVCLMLTAAFGLPHLLKHKEGISYVSDPDETVWGDPKEQEDLSNELDRAAVGSIVISGPLKDAMEERGDDTAIFAVLIMETTGKPREYIYSSFVEPLDVREEYMEHGVVFITERQIRALRCPPDLSIILSLAVKPAKE